MRREDAEDSGMETLIDESQSENSGNFTDIILTGKVQIQLLDKVIREKNDKEKRVKTQGRIIQKLVHEELQDYVADLKRFEEGGRRSQRHTGTEKQASDPDTIGCHKRMTKKSRKERSDRQRRTNRPRRDVTRNIERYLQLGSSTNEKKESYAYEPCNSGQGVQMKNCEGKLSNQDGKSHDTSHIEIVREDNNFIIRNIELAANANQIVPMTAADEARIEAILQECDVPYVWNSGRDIAELEYGNDGTIAVLYNSDEEGETNVQQLPWYHPEAHTIAMNLALTEPLNNDADETNDADIQHLVDRLKAIDQCLEELKAQQTEENYATETLLNEADVPTRVTFITNKSTDGTNCDE